MEALPHFNAMRRRLAKNAPALVLPIASSPPDPLPSQAAVAGHGGYFRALRVWGLCDEPNRILELDDPSEATRLLPRQKLILTRLHQIPTALLQPRPFCTLADDVATMMVGLAFLSVSDSSEASLTCDTRRYLVYLLISLLLAFH